MVLQVLNRFVRATGGNVATTLALAALPVSMMVGMGLDIANATRTKLALQDATDTAAISLARQAPSIADSAISTTAKSYIQASYNDTPSVTITNATIDRDTITATLDAKANVPAFFSQLLGVSTLPVTAHAVAKGMLLEIAMVLDTSGSMSEAAGSGGSKISALKTASDAFLDAMFGSQTTSQRVSVSIVPFAASVNVGPSNSDASWMDTTGKSSLQYEDFEDHSKTRWDLFDDLRNTNWAGCVISRPTDDDLDVTDAPPTSSNGDTLFVPWFAPDEPDSSNSFHNDYISDTGGTCGNNGNHYGQILHSPHLQQANSCKYKNASPAWGLGPNRLCDSRPITTLSNSRSTLDSAINALQANGNTNIEEGLMWGWRALSPGAPFTEGKAYNAPNNRKVIILMTDGVNNPGGTNNTNMSEYTSYGFAVNGHLGQATSNNATLTTLMDGRTAQACSNAKAQGILIYTIAFGADAAASQTLLRNCASDPKYFFAPQNSSDLTPVFQQIAQSVNSLRIAE